MIDETKKIEEHAHKIGAEGAKWLRSKYATPVLGLIAFAESLFAPILIDPFLVALILAKPQAWKRYTIVAIIASVMGGIAAYVVAAFFFNEIVTSVLAWEHFETQFVSISESLNESAFLFTLIGAITPIPYKLVALAAGFLQISFSIFLIASIIGRTVRMGFVGYCAYRFGPHALELFHSRFNIAMLLFLALAAIYIMLKVL